MDDRARPPTDKSRRFAWFQAMLGPPYFLLYLLSGKHHGPGGIGAGVLIACGLSGMGLVMLVRSRRLASAPPPAAVRVEGIEEMPRMAGGAREMGARLVGRGWLRRVVEVDLPDAPHVVEYDGSRVGYEQVTADGSVHRQRSIFWFVPRFEFKVGGRRGVVEVRVWPWLCLRSLVLRVGDRVVYAEGLTRWEAEAVARRDDWDDLA